VAIGASVAPAVDLAIGFAARTYFTLPSRAAHA
jgi:hypothetical protein